MSLVKVRTSNAFDMQASDPLPAPGFLKGYVRRFAQESHDHRGTEEVSNDAVPLYTLP